MKLEQQTFDVKVIAAMAVRKNLLYNATRYYTYVKHLYSIPVTNLTDFGLETRYTYYQLLQLDLAKLFCDHDMQKYNVHRLLRQFEKGGVNKKLLPANQVRLIKEKLGTFAPTIEGLHFVRDKWVAHTDQLGGIAPQETFFPAIESLLHFGFELLDVSSQALLRTPVYNTLITNSLIDLSLYKA